MQVLSGPILLHHPDPFKAVDFLQHLTVREPSFQGLGWGRNIHWNIRLWYIDGISRRNTTLHQTMVLKKFCYMIFSRNEVSCLIFFTTNLFKSYRNKSTPLMRVDVGFQHHHPSIEVDQVRLEVAGHLTAGLRISKMFKVERYHCEEWDWWFNVHAAPTLFAPYPCPMSDKNFASWLKLPICSWFAEEGVLRNALSVRNGSCKVSKKFEDLCIEKDPGKLLFVLVRAWKRHRKIIISSL